jgi:hypothetical protein
LRGEDLFRALRFLRSATHQPEQQECDDREAEERAEDIVLIEAAPGLCCYGRGPSPT